MKVLLIIIIVNVIAKVIQIDIYLQISKIRKYKLFNGHKFLILFMIS